MMWGSKNAETIRRIIQKNYRRRRSSTIVNETHCASTPPPSTVVLLRHGESLWNTIPTFTGWCDVPLTDHGIEQAEGAARLMKEKGFNFDLVYSSELKRAYQSAEVVLNILNDTARSKPIEPMKVGELNERQYVYSDDLKKSTISNNYIVLNLTQSFPSL